jgi:hypothetical protein
MRATKNEPVPLQVVAGDAQTGGLFARALVYQGNTLVATLPLPHIASGIYGTVNTFAVEGYYSVLYQFFLDSGFTSPAPEYDVGSEIIEVSSDKTNLIRLLGLAHENAVFDQQVYDGDGNLTSGRIRSYDSDVHANAAGATGLLFTWTITAVYTAGNLTSYKIVRA